MTFDVPQFKITDDAIKKFRRWVKKPRDCVINAMELLNILDDENADICRIMVGDTGLKVGQIEDIFSLLNPNFQWRFFRFTKIETLSQFTVDELKPDHAIFCGYIGQEGHVFLIAKTSDGKIVYIDPQVNEICPLEQSSCVKYINDKQAYFILQASPKK
jgi:hypothetical protein